MVKVLCLVVKGDFFIILSKVHDLSFGCNAAVFLN